MDGPLSLVPGQDLSKNAAEDIEVLAEDIPFWIELLEHREAYHGFDIRTINHVDEITQRDIDAQYDLTRRRIGQILRKFDTNGDEFISTEEFKKGLNAQGFVLKEAALSRLTIAMDIEKQGQMSEQKFAVVLQRLKLAELFTEKVQKLERQMAAEHRSKRNGSTQNQSLDDKVSPTANPEHSSFLNLTKYSIDTVESRPIEHIDDLKRWFFSSRQSQGSDPNSVHWVHMDGLDKIMLMRLAVKYRLHPIAVEDALEMCKQPAKVDRYNDQFFCAINALQLDERTKSKIELESPEPPRVRIHCSYICMFVGGMQSRHGSNLISIHQEQVFGHGSGATHSNSHPTKRDSMSSTSLGSSRTSLKRAPSFREHANTQGADIFDCVREELERSSRARDNKSDFLMYMVLDKCVDELSPIVEAYDARLSFFQARMRVMKTKFPRKWLDEISAVKMELMDFMRTVRPLNGALKHIVDDENVCRGFPMYLEDVQDHLEQVTEDAKGLVDICTCLAQDYNVFGDQKMNNTLYVLTVVTTIFIPAQFVAGMYGMNFVQSDGSPAIPELEWENGYSYFWGLVIGTSTCMILLFKCMSFL
eukprot:gnl/MRDRNA2_/MRDRNA2_157804_c0_seq1.p1 gnl/MRDRNA2_/MRDRNA2_157804_c0~~gnl/MRDRNA2_/MRDRNA2_157804_c0_seq1.p1  ORF type:complete len:588 (-),score=103.41 gnl/MRDRNA2_/MRDRNA2_157804_c0_seq1:155-1918(-)